MNPASPLKRRDEESDWHELIPVSCPSCGCTFHAAVDDPEIVWEPGRAWDEGCMARDCACHMDPVIGTRRDS